TCQGLELDYVGVIVGPDLIYRNGRVVTDASKRASFDSSVRGLKKMLHTDPDGASGLAGAIAKNTYRTLMTRGLKGCYIYCVDAPLAKYLESRLTSTSKLALASTVRTDLNAALVSVNVPPPAPLRRVTAEERAAGVAAAPVIQLQLAAAV